MRLVLDAPASRIDGIWQCPARAFRGRESLPTATGTRPHASAGSLRKQSVSDATAARCS